MLKQAERRQAFNHLEHRKGPICTREDAERIADVIIRKVGRDETALAFIPIAIKIREAVIAELAGKG